MSWPEPPPRGYAAPQPQGYGNQQQNMYPNYHNSAPGAQPQQQYWQQLQQQPQQQPLQMQQQQPQQPLYNQQYTGQVYQQDYSSNANQTYPQYNQTLPNQNYQPQQQAQYQNYYQTQPQQPTNYPPKQSKDNWDETWEWGWDEAAKQAQSQQQVYQTNPQPQAFNNANVIEDSFTSTDAWNWSAEDKQPLPPEPQPSPQHVDPEEIAPTNIPSNESVPSVIENSNDTHEEVKTLNDKDVKEKLPNLALGKRFHLENLTPQWSIESQMSQDSSDGIQTHSESTYQSEPQSRNSTSSPGVVAENLNYGHIEETVHSQEWGQVQHDQLNVNRVHEDLSHLGHENIVSSMQDMRISNTSNGFDESLQRQQIEGAVADCVPPPPPPSIASFPSSSPSQSMTSSLTQISRPLPVASPMAASTNSIPPTSSIPSSSTNPFKHAGPLSRKKVPSPMPTASYTPVSREIPASTNLTSPMAVNMVQSTRPGQVFGANLETAPENSERPDQPQISQFRPSPSPHPIPDNLEIAPRNDRNEYLQTAHLSSSDYRENTDFSRNSEPPPGLRRMVVGQQESEYSNLNLSGDEPPPGLSRMVPGQQNESETLYNQQTDDYLDREIDGWTDHTSRPYNQADGQQVQDFNQVPNALDLDIDRMVPGEPSNESYTQYANPNYSVNEERVVTGVDHDYTAAPSDVREVNMDGSEYTEPRGIQTVNDTVTDFNTEEQQREVIMEGENLEDLSLISSADVSYSRDQTVDGAGLPADISADRRTDVSDSIDAPATSSRRQSITRNTSGDDSERDRAFKASSRRDKHKRDRESNKDDKHREERKERDDRRGDRRSDRDRRDRDKDRERSRKERDVSPDERRHRRSTRSRKYETEDTDYYSDREKERRRYREGSYAASSKPPRPEDRDHRHDRDRSRRYATIERDRRYDDERDGTTRSRRSDKDRRYRDIDPSRRHGNLRRDDDRKRVVTFSAKSDTVTTDKGETYTSPSRSAAPTDEEASERTDERRRRRHHRRDDYYEGYVSSGGGGERAAVTEDPYALQRRQYEYYERLRRSDPAAYMQLYRRLVAGDTHYSPAAATYSNLGYEHPQQERGSVHSGRSSANGFAGNATWSRRADFREEYLYARAPSIRTDYSDRDMTTDASINLPLDESTARSDRMTPLKFATTHVKGAIGVGQLVLVQPGAVRLVPWALALNSHWDYPGPLVPGVTHKKSVVEYCLRRGAEGRARGPGGDGAGAALLWDLLAALIAHNGVLVGTDIAELLLKDTDSKAWRAAETPPVRGSASIGSRRTSSTSAEGREACSPPAPAASPANVTRMEESIDNNDPAVLETFREYLLYGNREQALELAMRRGLWGHALLLAPTLGGGATSRAAARFLAALPPRDPLHTLYARRAPPALTAPSHRQEDNECWRVHVAMIIANSALAPLVTDQEPASAKAENDRRIIIHIGDTLAARGQIYSAQFCHLVAGVQFRQHWAAPLGAGAGAGGGRDEPPRLCLVLGDARAPCWRGLATDDAICATEIYEYARALHSPFVLDELQVYKWVWALRLAEAGECARALAYCEAVARALQARPRAFPPALLTQVAALADRLQYFDPSLTEDPPLLEEGVPAPASPRRDWLRDVIAAAAAATGQQVQPAAEVQSTPATPQHLVPTFPVQSTTAQQQYEWQDQQALYSQPTFPPPAPEPPAPAPAPAVDDAPDYTHYYPHQQPTPDTQSAQQQGGNYNSYTEDWYGNTGAAEDASQTYGDPYWQPDYSGYGNETRPRGLRRRTNQSARATDKPPANHRARTSSQGGAQITMPGANRPQDQANEQNSDHEPEPKTQQNKSEVKPAKETSKSSGDKPSSGGKSGWLGGILNKLSLRPPNQMILPDDKNPTIVWDADAKRWRNTDGGGEDSSGPPPPPPSIADLASKHAAPAPAAGAAGAGPPSALPPPPGTNMFKMQRTRNIKKSYVDVFNPGVGGGGAARAAGEAPLAPAPAPLASAPKYFIPAPHQGGYDQQSGEQWTQ